MRPLSEAGLDQHPRRVANRRDRLPGFVEVADEGDGVLVGAQQVGVDLPAGNDERIVLVGCDRIDGAVHLD